MTVPNRTDHEPRPHQRPEGSVRAGAQRLVPPSEGAGDEPPDLPTTGPGSLKDRVLRPRTIVSFLLALAIGVFFITRLDIDPHEVWDNARRTNPFLYALAFASFYLGFILRAIRWRSMLGRAGVSEKTGYPIPSLPSLIEIYIVSWFANCVVPAKLGDAYRSYMFKRDSGASFSTTLGTILSERLIDLVALFVAMVGSAVVVFGTHLPGQANNAVIGGAVLLGIGAIGLAVMWFAREHLERRLPERVRDQYSRLHGAVFASLRRPEGYFAISLVVWLSEGLRLYLVCLALDADVPFTTAIFVALLASLLTALPFTPAGLGVVEGGMTIILGAVGIGSSLAFSITLLDRVIGYWSVILVGFLLYLHRMRKEIVEVEPAATVRSPSGSPTSAWNE